MEIKEILKIIDEVNIIIPDVEPPPNGLSQNQIFGAGQINMKIRIVEKLNQLT